MISKLIFHIDKRKCIVCQSLIKNIVHEKYLKAIVNAEICFRQSVTLKV